MLKYKMEYGHDLDLLLSKMVNRVNNGEIILVNYSTCKEGLIFWLSYTFTEA